jgi:hypothetical protein
MGGLSNQYSKAAGVLQESIENKEMTEKNAK